MYNITFKLTFMSNETQLSKYIEQKQIQPNRETTKPTIIMGDSNALLSDTEGSSSQNKK